MGEEVIEKVPNLECPQLLFELSLPDELVANKQQLKQKLLDAITVDSMVPFYLHVSERLQWPVDQAFVDKMKKDNETKLEQLDATIKDATENLGESEVREAFLAKAVFYARIGDKENAVNQYRLTGEKTVGSGQKLDLIFTLIRLGLFWEDHDLITRNIEKARSMVEQGTDWDRRNRLKVYEALYYLSIRKFSEASSLLLDTISTFTAVELLDYQTYIYYTVLMALVSLDRVSLKQKVIDAPEILAVIDNVPHLSPLLNSLYSCNYALFFTSLAGITDNLKTNRYFAPHSGFYCKELRILAYKQLLESYRSVQLETMASAFGVSTDFIDRELSRFIASGRLNCKIDKVGGIVETNRADTKNAQYQSILKQGDSLLNKVQRLSRVINV